MDTKTSVLAVEGMTCPSCVAHIGRALRDIDGVESIDVRLREGTVVVKHDNGTSIATMVEAIRDAGYESAPKS